MKMRETNVRRYIIVLMAVLSVILSENIHAAPWTPASNVRIVQKSNIDNTRVFDSIQAAIDSIITASEQNPYIVKVMPGVYNETVRMKSFVSLVGSGQDNTIINSLSSTDSFTILTATDSSNIENLMVTYGGSVSGFGDTGIIKVQGGAKVNLKDVKIQIPNTFRILAISGTNNPTPGTSAVLNNVYIYREAGEIGDPAINLWTSTGKLTIYNSRFELYGTDADAIYGSGTVEIHDTSFILTSTDGWAEIWDRTCGGVVLRLYNCTATISPARGYVLAGQTEIYNSVINVSGPIDEVVYLTWGTSAVISNSTITSSTVGLKVAGGDAKISNSVISGQTMGIQKSGGNFSIGNSQIVGGHNGTQGVDKVINCYDGDYNAISNI